MARILSGIQSSGQLHIGNYLGMMKPMIEQQENNELFCFIANYHAMTTLKNSDELKKNTIEAAMDFLALGLDPDKCYFWVQSDIPEIQELTWILGCSTSLGLLERSTSYKDKIAKGITTNAGLYTYPVLMAADILMFQADKVPVGKDQKQHLEIARDIAVTFNTTYGETFTLPEPVIREEVAIVPGIDGQKMSKSYGNAIFMFEEEKSLRRKIMKIITDSKDVDEPKDPDRCNIFQLYKLFATPEQTADLRKRYLKGGLGYGTAKTELFEILLDFFGPFRKIRNDFAADPDSVRKILKKGADKTREVAFKTLSEVREKVGINY
jgi:tryptophanyl-tRNA synthetase